MRPSLETPLGALYLGTCEKLLKGRLGDEISGQVNLIVTSPPFPLNNKKSYGNLQGDAYLEWFSGLAPIFSKLLSPDGSLVIELGNAWEPGRPVQSLLPIESLLSFAKNESAGLRLCQQFICYNPTRLPSPAQWVTVKRTRLTDSYTNVWWFAKQDNPKASNRRVLRPYSEHMRRLLRRGSYNSGKRPSEFYIGETSFLTDNGGSIAHNVFEIEAIEPGKPVRLPNALRFPNTGSSDPFMRACRERGIKPHPARMPPELAAFFLEFLTDPGDLVLDPFAGSNTTGDVAERLGRRWVTIEAEAKYLPQALIRSELTAQALSTPLT